MDPHQMNDTPPCPATYLISERPVEFVEGRTYCWNGIRHHWYRIEDLGHVYDTDTHWCHSDTRPTHDPRETPCPNATPEWAVKAAKEIAALANDTDWDNRPTGISESEALKVVLDHATTAGVPATSELVERLRKMAKCIYLATDKVVADDIADGLNHAIAALQQLAPLAGEVERLQKKSTDACIAWTEVCDKLAASERERDTATNAYNIALEQVRVSSEQVIELRVERDDLWHLEDAWKDAFPNHSPGSARAELRNARTQLAAAKLDGDALAEVVQQAYIENQNLHCSTTISPKIGWDALERQTAILRQALAHRARGAAGGKA